MTKNALPAAVGLLLLWVASAAGLGREITEVQVRGNLRVESGRILQQIGSSAGVDYDEKRIRGDIQEIYSLGYFEDIIVEFSDDGVLTFVVLERPALHEWRTAGAEELDEEDVKEAVTLKRREILNEERVEEAAAVIRDLYMEKGYYLAEVRPEVVPVADGKNQADVVFEVQEGEKVRIKDVHLMGVQQLAKEEVGKYLATKPAGPWSWFTSSGTFKEADLQRDREVIRGYYLNHGYVEVEVGEPLISLTADREWLKVDIPVTEGDPYTVGPIEFSGDLEFSEQELLAATGLQTGETFRTDDFRRAHDGLSDLYGDIGYAFVEIDPRTRLDREQRTVSLRFEIHKGDLVHIGRVEVRGNTKTHDRVVRRDMRLAEGDLYSGTAIRQSRRKIENLGFFETVNLTTRRRPGANLVDVTIEVEEKATGSFSFGAGYSSVDKVMGMVSVSQRNFLGRAYQMSLSGHFSFKRTAYTFTFNNPRVFDSRVGAGIDLYNATREYADYDKEAVGAAFKLGTSLSEDWRIRGIYRIEEADVKDVSAFASELIRDQEGITVTSSLTGVLTYDSRDNPWEPHRGAKGDWSVEWAGGVLQGDAEFVKGVFDGSKYVALWWDHVLTLHGRIGYIEDLNDKEIPIYERFYLGGITTLRGFDSRSVSPEDEETGDEIGGNKELLFNVEYLFPLIKEAKVRGLFFFDAGNAWEEGDEYSLKDLRESAGFGVRWFSPLGPLRLEWGYVLDRKQGEKQSQWEFSMGGFF